MLAKLGSRMGNVFEAPGGAEGAEEEEEGAVEEGEEEANLHSAASAGTGAVMKGSEGSQGAR